MRAPFLWRAVIGIIALVSFASFPAYAQTTNGIYADFVTSQGNFTVYLDYINAPKTVANFIGLATGQKAWMDWNTGQVRTNPFYNGLTFHRVVSNFVIQAGSPNGLGTDGPGYVIKDEFSPNLRHNKTGVVAMAKSPSPINNDVLPHTASSQFYITLSTSSTVTNLDAGYCVFGQVTSNLQVALNIGRVATDTNSKPLTPVVINSVSIRRVGTAAQNFNIQAQSLPSIQKVPLQITHTGQQVTLRLSNNFPYAQTRLFDSTSLQQWNFSELGLDLAPPLLTNIVQAATNHMSYYNATRVQYPSSTWAHRNLYGRSLKLVFGDGSGSGTAFFDRSGAGSYTDGIASSGSLSYSYFQDIYNGYLYPLDAWNLFYLNLFFTSETNGSFSGYVWLGLWWPTYGSFSLSSPYIPGAVNLLSPADRTTETNLQTTFAWTASDPAATFYNLLVFRNGTNYLSNWVQTTSYTHTNALPKDTNYTWAVRGWNSEGFGPWSRGRQFVVPTRIPAQIQLVSPSGATTAGAKDYTWVADPYAMWYHLLVYKNGAPFLDQWYAKDSLTVVNPNRLSIRVTTSHTSGSYSWWVQALGPDGTGPYSATMSFSIP